MWSISHGWFHSLRLSRREPWATSWGRPMANSTWLGSSEPEVQAELAQRILPLLTEEEQAVFRRGRNANVHSIPTHASRAQYQQATALEALLGWLHLSGRHDRVEQLFAVMMEEE